MKALLAILASLVAGILCVAAYSYAEALRDPIIRRATIRMADWPADEPPRTVLLLSDTHVGGPDMTPARLARIVTRLNDLHADLVILAGDYVSRKPPFAPYTPADSIAPLAALHAPLGVVAVFGNHDRHRGSTAFRRAFGSANIPLLMNSAVRRGPFRVAGVDDPSSGRMNMGAMLSSLNRLGPGPTILLAHTPAIAAALPGPASAVVLSGHTHCGQIILPLIGPVAALSRHHDDFRCGLIRDGMRPLVITGGLGTSILPIRLGAPPDVWLIRFGPLR